MPVPVPTLADRDVERYLDRIGAARPSRPDLASLATLQLTHLQRVPFENLDIGWGVSIVLGLDAVLDKVVERRRGGYCYELNSAFGALLATLGYGVEYVSARVARREGGFGPDFDHLALVVQADGQRVPALVDVGFGDGSRAPLPLVHEREQPDGMRRVRVVRDGDEWSYEEDGGDGWQVRYRVDPRPRELREFAAMNEWQQSSPDSPFVARTICSLLTPTGRITVSAGRLIVSEGTERSERELHDDELESILRERFGIEPSP